MEYDIKILNGLIATTIDSVNGYREALEDAEGQNFRSIFADRANEREAVVTELRARVSALGGNPEDDGTLAAGAHRLFMNIKDSLTGSDDTAIIAEVERGEDHIKAKYEAALADQDLSPETAAVVRTAFTSVKAGHDQMRDLKHGMASANY